MTIGEKIKELRKKNDITQEKLADYLNISYQAISKWENNTALPDISMVVPIASFFGVSTDTLFDLDGKEEEAEVEAFAKDDSELWHQGKVRESLNLCRKFAAKYPRNYNCLSSLANTLLSSTMSMGFSGDEQEANRKECIEVCERILADCTDDKIRSSVIQTLVLQYSQNGEDDKALEIAKQAPSLYCSREIMSDLSYSNHPEALKQHCWNITLFTDLLTSAIWCRQYDTDEEHIYAYETALKILNLVFDDGNFLFYHNRLWFIYRQLAILYAKKNNKEKTIECLNKALYHATEEDNLPNEETNYTGIFINKAIYSPSNTSKNYTQTNVQLLADDLNNKCFDAIRGDSDFIEFVNKLK